MLGLLCIGTCVPLVACHDNAYYELGRPGNDYELKVTGLAMDGGAHP